MLTLFAVLAAFVATASAGCGTSLGCTSKYSAGLNTPYLGATLDNPFVLSGSIDALTNEILRAGGMNDPCDDGYRDIPAPRALCTPRERRVCARRRQDCNAVPGSNRPGCQMIFDLCVATCRGFDAPPPLPPRPYPPRPYPPRGPCSAADYFDCQRIFNECVDTFNGQCRREFRACVRRCGGRDEPGPYPPPREPCPTADYQAYLLARQECLNSGRNPAACQRQFIDDVNACGGFDGPIPPLPGGCNPRQIRRCDNIRDRCQMQPDVIGCDVQWEICIAECGGFPEPMPL